MPRIATAGLATTLIFFACIRGVAAAPVAHHVSFQHHVVPLVRYSGSPHSLIPTTGNSAYDIESYDYYCTGGGTACTHGYLASDCANGFVYEDIGTGCAGLNYAKVDAYGPANGSTSATPQGLYLVCAHYTATGSQVAYLDVYSSAGASTYGNLGGDLGPITGTASLLGWFSQNPPNDPNYPEDNPSQTSSVHASAIDWYSGYNFDGNHGTVSGVQNTDNINDLPNTGGFNITIAGEIDRFDLADNFISSYNGTITCLAGGPHALDLTNANLDEDSGAEGELEWDYTGDSDGIG